MSSAGAGDVNVNPVEGQKTSSGAQKETFGTGSAAQSEAGKKGAAISAQRPAEERQAAAQKAADTRAERYGDQTHYDK